MRKSACLPNEANPKRRSAGVHQFIISPVEEHSKKPDVTRDKIIELAGDLPRVELFARQKAPGWDVWGNEVDSDLSLTPQMYQKRGDLNGLCDRPQGLDPV